MEQCGISNENTANISMWNRDSGFKKALYSEEKLLLQLHEPQL